MFYRLLADLIAAIHLGYVAFVVVGLVLIVLGTTLFHWRWVRNFWFRVVHFLMIAIVVAESLGGVVCPLTTWEDQLRRLGGGQAQEGTFVGRLVHRLMFFDAPDWAFPVGYCVFGAAVLLALLLAPPRWPGQHTKKKTAIASDISARPPE